MMNHTTNDAPVRLCKCGCGQPLRNYPGRFSPSRYIRGHQHYRPAIERFWEKVTRNTQDGCWNWTGCMTASGYGQINIDGKMIRSHRYIWEVTNGPIPIGFVVMHTCDNRRCVNPAHLRLGTQIANITDRMKKGRQAKGSTHPDAKLTEAQVSEIRRRQASGRATVAALAIEYGVSKPTIFNIVARRIWKHVP